MKIALIGYGKMGKAIEKQATNRGHEIALTITSKNADQFSKEQLDGIDVAIEFTNPHSAVPNIGNLIEYNLPIVCGSTGWHDQLTLVKNLVEQSNGSLIYASNFSLGVNLFFLINEYAAALLAPYNDYNASITEIHHTAKLDAPSGTAISIARGIIENNASYVGWINSDCASEGQLPILSKRIDPVPGTHIVHYKSVIDTIELSHEAHSREGFALGAVIAAEWIVGKKGVFTMRDLFINQ